MFSRAPEGEIEKVTSTHGRGRERERESTKTDVMEGPPLTPNAASALWVGKTDFKPVLQCTDLTDQVSPGTSESFLVHLSDGTHFMEALLDARLTQMVEKANQGEFETGSVVRLDKFRLEECNTVHNRETVTMKIVIVLQSTTLGKRAVQGSPTHVTAIGKTRVEEGGSATTDTEEDHMEEGNWRRAYEVAMPILMPFIQGPEGERVREAMLRESEYEGGRQAAELKVEMIDAVHHLFPCRQDARTFIAGVWQYWRERGEKFLRVREILDEFTDCLNEDYLDGRFGRARRETVDAMVRSLSSLYPSRGEAESVVSSYVEEFMSSRDRTEEVALRALQPFLVGMASPRGLAKRTRAAAVRRLREHADIFPNSRTARACIQNISLSLRGTMHWGGGGCPLQH